jgi:hypothetical protein
VDQVQTQTALVHPLHTISAVQDIAVQTQNQTGSVSRKRKKKTAVMKYMGANG